MIKIDSHLSGAVWLRVPGDDCHLNQQPPI
jgi:hypothetical protein